MKKRLLKLTSLAMASMIFISPTSILAHATKENETASSKNVSSKKNTKKMKTKYKNALIIGACGLGIDAVALIAFLMYSNKTPVSADTWFARLGGTQEDIDSYKQLFEDYNNDKISIDKKLATEIDKDTNRYPTHITQRIQLDDFKKTFSRILKIYYTKHLNISYHQGWDHIVFMIYNKFMISRNTNELLSLDDEAKVYFIYTKFIKMINNKFGDAFSDIKELLSQCEYYYKKSGIEVTDDGLATSVIQNIFLRGIFTAGTCLFSDDDSARKIMGTWDKIITDDRFVSPLTHDFNEEITIDHLNKYIGTMLCEPNNDTLRKNVGIPLICSGNKLTAYTP